MRDFPIRKGFNSEKLHQIHLLKHKRPQIIAIRSFFNLELELNMVFSNIEMFKQFSFVSSSLGSLKDLEIEQYNIEVRNKPFIKELKDKIAQIDVPYRRIHYLSLFVYTFSFILGILGFGTFISMPLKLSAFFAVLSIIFLILSISANYEATRRRKKNIEAL